MATWFDDVDEAALRNHYGDDEISQVATRDSSAVEQTVVSTALTDARAEVGKYLRRRYSFAGAPLSTPADVQRIICDIARYRLYDDDPPDEVTKRYERSIDELKALASGDADLFDSDAALLTSWGAIETEGAGSGDHAAPAFPKRVLRITDAVLAGYPS